MPPPDRRRAVVVVVGLLATLVLVVVPVAAPAADTAGVARIAGPDRHATATRISAATFPTGTDTAWVGGRGAVGDEVVATLEGLATTVVRRAGPTRYHTGVAVSRATFAPGLDTVWLASGAAFPDALAAAPVAGRRGEPVLLTRPDRLPPVVADEIRRLSPRRVVVLGGTGAVAASVADEVAGLVDVVERIGGSDRHATAAAVSRRHFGSATATAWVAAGAVFRDAYEARFPIRRMRTIEAYGGDDDASMAADNTSAFNCRPITGGTTWSRHSFGTAIDVNPVENPYVKGDTVLPEAGRAHLDRTRHVPGMLHDGDELVAAFARRGFGWGGAWSSPVDYQHFER